MNKRDQYLKKIKKILKHQPECFDVIKEFFPQEPNDSFCNRLDRTIQRYYELLSKATKFANTSNKRTDEEYFRDKKLSKELHGYDVIKRSEKIHKDLRNSSFVATHILLTVTTADFDNFETFNSSHLEPFINKDNSPDDKSQLNILEYISGVPMEFREAACGNLIDIYRVVYSENKEEDRTVILNKTSQLIEKTTLEATKNNMRAEKRGLEPKDIHKKLLTNERLARILAKNRLQSFQIDPDEKAFYKKRILAKNRLQSFQIDPDEKAFYKNIIDSKNNKPISDINIKRLLQLREVSEKIYSEDLDASDDEVKEKANAVFKEVNENIIKAKEAGFEDKHIYKELLTDDKFEKLIKLARFLAKEGETSHAR